MKFIKYRLKDQAVAAMQEVLERGNSLASALLRNQNLENGNIETWLPEGVSEDKIYKFSQGGILPTHTDSQLSYRDKKGNLLQSTSVDSSEAHLVESLLTYLQDNPLQFAVFENPIVEPHFPWLKTPVRKSRILLYEKEVTNVVTADEGTIDLVTNLLGEIGGLGPWPGLIGAIACGDADLLGHWKRDFSEVSAKDLQKVASRATKIIVGVHDDESYLLWSKL